MAIKKSSFLKRLRSFGSRKQQNYSKEYTLLVAQFILEEISGEIQFDHSVYADILTEYMSFINNDELPSPNHFVQHSNPTISQVATDVMSNRYELSENWKNTESIQTLKMYI